MKSFKHFDAATVEACSAMLSTYSGRALPIAGGTGLLGVLKDRILPDFPEALVNLKTIPGLSEIQEGDGRLTVGAMAGLEEIASNPVIKEKYGALGKAAALVATPVIRKRATIGGNLCQDVRCWYYRYPHSLGGRINCLRKGALKCPALAGDNRYHAIMEGKRCFAVCPSDTAVALSALEAEIVVRGPDGMRVVPVDSFYTALGNILDSSEIVTGIRIPEPPAGAKQTFIKFVMRKPLDFAIVSVASVISVEDGVWSRTRISIGAVAPRPIRAKAVEARLTGQPINDRTIRVAAEEATTSAKPLSRNGYKVEIVKALVRRAIKAEPV